jgi:hypothetical protein
MGAIPDRITLAGGQGTANSNKDNSVKDLGLLSGAVKTD